MELANRKDSSGMCNFELHHVLRIERESRQHCVGFDLPTGTYDFAFISSRAYMITVTTNYGSIELYTFSGGDDDDESRGRAAA